MYYENNKTLDISWETILKIALVVLALYILFLIKDIVIWFLFAFVIAVLLDAPIDLLQRTGLPRVASAIIVYIVILGVLTLLVFLVAPMIRAEVQHFSQALPQYFEHKLSPSFKALGFKAFESIETFVQTLDQSLDRLASNVFNVISSIFGGIISALFIIILSIFLSLEEKGVRNAIVLIFPKKYEASASAIWVKCQKKVVAWFGARVLACVFVGLVSYLIFIIFRTEYPVILALISGVLNFIPLLGPLLAGGIIFLFVFSEGVVKALFILLAFFFLQILEGNILTPLLMKRAMAISPAIILIAVVIGAKLWGVLGAVLVIPALGIAIEFLRNFLKERRERQAVSL